MNNDITSAADIAKKRLYEFIDNLILISAFNDVALWGLFTFLFEQVKNYDPNKFSISSMAYKQDKDEAAARNRQKDINFQMTETTLTNQKKINSQESETRLPERSRSRSF